MPASSNSGSLSNGRSGATRAADSIARRIVLVTRHETPATCARSSAGGGRLRSSGARSYASTHRAKSRPRILVP
jgi:hypothetical protein